jgi:hypothetical protein
MAGWMGEWMPTYMSVWEATQEDKRMRSWMEGWFGEKNQRT